MSLTLPTPQELESYRIIAAIAASNPHWRKLGGGGTDEQIIATILSVMLLARELGVSPMQSISGGINNIQGKFEISARIMNQLMRKHGHKIQVQILTDQMCKIWGQRTDTGEEMEVTYHIEEAARAGLIRDSGGWKKNPQDMLFARAISRLARRLTPDCIGGCYVEGELQETILKQPVESIDMPVIEMAPQEAERPIREQIHFEIPADVAVSAIENFIRESAQTSNTTCKVLIERANKNPEGFMNVFRKWEDARSLPELTPDPNQELAEV